MLHEAGARVKAVSVLYTAQTKKLITAHLSTTINDCFI